MKLGIFRFPAALALLGLSIASGQTQDNSQNGLLKGSYRFRHVAVLGVDGTYDPSEVNASYGSITFDGAGNYTISGTSVDNTVSGGAPKPLNVSGTYAIGSNGAGYIANPLFPTDVNAYIYGAAAQGIYTGSSTEVGNEGLVLNDIFIAIPVGSPPTNASFTSPYQTGLLDFQGGVATSIMNALFELAPNGKGGFGPLAINGQSSNSNVTASQPVTGATYNFSSDGSATLMIPLSPGVTAPNALFTGSKTMFESADGNFILGWTATGYDIFFGVKALTTNGTNSASAGLYFTAALEDSTGAFGTDSYYGGVSNAGNSKGDGIIHQRFNLTNAYSYDYGSDDQIDVNADGTTSADFLGYMYVFGDGEQAFVAIGSNGTYSLLVGMHAASFSGSGVFLNPAYVVNAASYAPVTASLAPGELINLYGTGLSPVSMSMQGGQVFPTGGIGGVTVTIDGLPCPVYYVSSTQISVIVPYGVASNMTALADIQVNNNGQKSNVVQMYLTDAEPGAFSQGQNGIGLAAALHAATYAEITPSDPAQDGETIALYLTGLGPVTPAIKDGALGPSPTLSNADVFSAGNLAVYFNDYSSFSVLNQGTIVFAGLTPGLAGLYQLNVTLPSGALTPGDNVYVEFVTDAADVNQIQIPFGSGSAASAARPARRSPAARLAARQRASPKRSAHRMIRRGAAPPPAN